MYGEWFTRLFENWNCGKRLIQILLQKPFDPIFGLEQAIGFHWVYQLRNLKLTFENLTSPYKIQTDKSPPGLIFSVEFLKTYYGKGMVQFYNSSSQKSLKRKDLIADKSYYLLVCLISN